MSRAPSVSLAEAASQRLGETCFLLQVKEEKPRLGLWLLWASDTPGRDEVSTAELGFQSGVFRPIS